MKNNTLIFVGLIAILVVVGFVCLQKSRNEKMTHEPSPPVRLYNLSPEDAPQQTEDYEIIGEHQNNFSFGAGASDKTTTEYPLI